MENMKKRIAALVCILAFGCGLTGYSEEKPDMLSEITETVYAGDESVSRQEKTEELKNMLECMSFCKPEDVLKKEDLEAYNTVRKKAADVLNDETSEEDKIDEAIENLKNAVAGLKYIKDEVILTNNKFEAPGDYYPQNEIINTSASYTFLSGDSISANDAENEKLSDGREENIGAETETAVILYDLGGEYYLTGADVYSLRTSGSRIRRIKGFDVEVSADGKTFSKVCAQSADGTQQNLRTDSKIPAVPARYVRISVYKADNAINYSLREIVLKGIEYKFSKDELYETIVSCYGVKKNRCSDQSYSAYISAYDEAEAIYWDESVTGREIADAKDKLQNAFDKLEYISTTAILSGNVRSEADKEYYSDYRIDTVPGIKYWYADNCDENVTQNSDPSCVKLLQGGCNISSPTGNVAEGVYGSNSPDLKNRETIVAVFDLGDTCYVNGVDVWEWYRTAQHIGKVTVEISNDNINYTQVSEIANSKTGASDGVSNNISQEFGEVVCRYVRVTAYRVIKSMVNEVVIKGFKIEKENETPYVFGAFDYKNENGDRVRSIDGGTIKVSGKIINNNSDILAPTVVTVAYGEDNSLVAWDYTAVCSGEFENVLDLNGESNVRLYSFIIDSCGGGKPLSGMKLFGKI